MEDFFNHVKGLDKGKEFLCLPTKGSFELLFPELDRLGLKDPAVRELTFVLDVMKASPDVKPVVVGPGLLCIHLITEDWARNAPILWEGVCTKGVFKNRFAPRSVKEWREFYIMLQLTLLTPSCPKTDAVVPHSFAYRAIDLRNKHEDVSWEYVDNVGMMAFLETELWMQTLIIKHVFVSKFNWPKLSKTDQALASTAVVAGRLLKNLKESWQERKKLSIYKTNELKVYAEKPKCDVSVEPQQFVMSPYSNFPSTQE